MAMLSTFSEFTGGGVIWEEGLAEIYNILMGSLGMGEHEHLAAAAASTSATAPIVFRNTKNMKVDHRLRPEPRCRTINSTSPLPLSATMNHDPATITIVTTATTHDSKAGRGLGLGAREEANDDFGHRWARPLVAASAAAAHPYAHLAGIVFAILVVVGLIGFRGFSWRNLKRESWRWLRLACVTPAVFGYHFWICRYAADNELDVVVEFDEEYAKTGIIHRAVTCLRLVPRSAPVKTQPEAKRPPKPEGNHLVGVSGRPPGGISQKPKSLSFQKRAWRTARTKFLDFVTTLSAFISFLWALGRDLVRLVVQFVDGIRRLEVALRPFGVRIAPAAQDWKNIDPDLLESNNDGKGKKGVTSGNKSNKGRKNGGNGGAKKGKGRQR